MAADKQIKGKNSPVSKSSSTTAAGIVRLTAQATTAVTGIVRDLHQSISDTVFDTVLDKTPVPAGPVSTLTRDITGLVYKSIHGVTQLSAKAAELLFRALQPLLEQSADEQADSPRRAALLAALNGVVGDHLVADSNPLAIDMSLRFRGLALNGQTPLMIPGATGKVLLLVHGLCMNDLQWRSRNADQVVDHGQTLASELGYTPVYLRYNSGLHTSQNGRELAAQLERLLVNWPVAVEELSIVAHSMGGLLSRSALHYAKQQDLNWPQHLQKMVFLGTPHHGAPLERFGNWLDMVLGKGSYTAPFTALGRIRSAGITDLRYGHVLDEDWQHGDRFHRHPDKRRAVPLPEDVDCYTIAATTADRSSTLANHLIGDGLVPLHSALGKHTDPQMDLMFKTESQMINFRMNHMELLSSPTISQQLIDCLRPS